VSNLKSHGIDRVYSVPGESFLPVLDALFEDPDIDLVTCRHEGSAGFAAIADVKLTGRPGIFFVSRGPGAFNGSIALHVAEQEAIPLIMFIGQVESFNLGKGVVQEIDSSKAFAGTLKWSAKIDNPATANEVLNRAFLIAQTGTPGPVCIELPEDVLSMQSTEESYAPDLVASPECSIESAKECAALLCTAKRPILVIGGECRSPEFRTALLELSERWGLPVIAANKCQDQFPNTHQNWIGQQGFFASAPITNLFNKTDLFLAIGTRFGDTTSLGFTFPLNKGNDQRIIQVYPDKKQLGRHFTPTLGIESSSESFVEMMLKLKPNRGIDKDWKDAIASTREANTKWDSMNIPSADVLGHAVTALAQHLESDAIITTDSGNFAAWVHRIIRLSNTNRLLGSACGSMGTGVPSSLSASLRYPKKQVIAFCGDGGFLMNGNELATAVERGLNLIIVISNNNSYGTIRTHQQRNFPERLSGTNLSNPNFIELAHSFGANGYLIQNADEASSIMEQVFRAKGPTVVEVRCDADYGIEKSIQAMQ
jgi:acetolactate synthase-1/2/3 large subunit